LIATILSAQCTDERVNIVTATLFRKYRGPKDFVDVEQEELEKDIRSTGFFRNKTKNIKAASSRILEVYGGEVPKTMDDLLTLGGVARRRLMLYWKRVRYRKRSCGRYARRTPLAAAWTEQKSNGGEDRTGPDKTGA
jgi:endonuclease III